MAEVVRFPLALVEQAGLKAEPVKAETELPSALGELEREPAEAVQAELEAETGLP